MAVVLAQAAAGGVGVELLGLEDEADLVDVGGGGKLVHLLEGELDVVAMDALGGTCRHFVEHHVLVLAQIDEIGVSAFYDGLRLMTAAGAGDADVELVGVVLLEGNVDAVLGDERLTLLDSLLGAVLQYLELQLGTADEGAEGNGDGQSDHACAGNADTHGVLQDIATEAQLDMLWQTAEDLACLCDAQGYGNRLGAPDGWHHLAVNEVNNRLLFFLC